jgi:Rad3-related DNA helicase
MTEQSQLVSIMDLTKSSLLDHMNSNMNIGENHIQLFTITITHIILGLYIYMIGYLLIAYLTKLTNRISELESQMSRMTSHIEDQFNDKVNITVLNLQKDIINNVKELKNDMLENMRMMTENMELLEEMLQKTREKILEIEDIMDSNTTSLTKELSIVSEKCDTLIENVEDNNKLFNNNIHELKTKLDKNTRFVVYGNTGGQGCNKLIASKTSITKIDQLRYPGTTINFYLSSLEHFTNMKELDLAALYMLSNKIVDECNELHIIDSRILKDHLYMNMKDDVEFYKYKPLSLLLREEGTKKVIDYVYKIRPDMKLLWNNELIE